MYEPFLSVFRTLITYLFTALILAAMLFVIFAWPAVATELHYRVSGIMPLPSVSPAVLESHESRISIPAIGVSAPVLWDIPSEQSEDFLPKGVIQLKGSSKPELGGNTVLLGHSSDYPWKKDPYATVFTLLPKLKVGDTISLIREGSPYYYKVTKTFTIRPENVEIVSNSTTPQLTLLTCYPIGTTLLRYVIQAEPLAAP